MNPHMSDDYPVVDVKATSPLVREGNGSMKLPALEHVTIHTTNIEESVAFYREFLGLNPGFRPPVDPPGVWLYVEGATTAMIHLIDEDPESEIAKAASTGKFDHFNLRMSGLDAYLAKVKASNQWYTAIPLMAGLSQIQHRDPSGVMVELSFFGETIAAADVVQDEA